MNKKIIAILIALGLAGGGSAMAQNVSPFPVQVVAPKVVPLPLKIGCMTYADAQALMNASQYSPLIRGQLVLVRPEGELSPANDGTNSTLWYSRKENSIVSFLWNQDKNIACVTHMIKDITIDESAWSTIGRPVSDTDDE